MSFAQRTLKTVALAALTCLMCLATLVPTIAAAHKIDPNHQDQLIATSTVAVTTKPVNWTNKTCHALEAWQRHRDGTDLYRLTTYAAHLGKSWLKADVLELAADVASPSKKAAQYVDVALQYAADDCGQGGM